MKKFHKILIVLLAIAALLAYGVYWAFFDIQRIEGQQLLSSADSPDGRYTVTSYLNNGGATIDDAVLCTVRDNQTGRKGISTGNMNPIPPLLTGSTKEPFRSTAYTWML